VVSTNPATLLGFGTWVAFAAGRVLIGNDGGSFGTDEGTGGASTVTPSAHANGGVSAHSGAAVATHGAHTHTGASAGTTPKLFTSNTSSGVPGISGSESAALTHSVTQPANHTVTQPDSHAALSTIQPYVVVHMWKRTA
jgi:hypothetical protein